ncbi:AAA ATPase midasin [Entophlyctis sp. JEL0112]|nr:AAA ATPase midasin [Entophlyctis sp. JEL0112]
MLYSLWVESIDDHEFIPQIKSILFEAAYFWHKSIWENSGMILASSDTYDRDIFLCHGNVHEIPKGVQANAGKIGGPQLLNSSSGSKMGLALLGTLEHVPIYAFEGKIKQIHELSSVFSEPVLENFVEEALEAHLDIIMLTLQQIIDGYRGCFAEGVHERIVSRLLAIRGDIFKDSEYVNRMLGETRLLIHSIPENPRGHLKMVLNILSNVATKGLSFESVGQAYIFVSMGFLRSYLPESAIDPALSSQYELEMMSKVAQKIKSDIVVDLEYQYMCLTDSVAHDDQFKKLKEITAASKAIQRKMVYRPKKSEIEQIVNDLTHLGSNVLRDQSIYSCVSDGDSHNRQFLQTSLQAYVEKTEMKYPLYRDILQPVFLSLYQLRLGLSYIEADKNSGVPVEVNDLMKSLLEFTGLMTSSDLDNDKFSVALQKVPIVSYKLAEIDTLLSVIRRFCWGVRYQNALHESDLSALNNWLNKLSNSWLEAEALAAEKEKADAELYKYKEKSHEILTEEEYDEKDLLSVFPDFALDFEFLENNLGEDQDVSQKIDNGVHAGTIDADESVAFKIREMHYSLFSGAANFEDQKESYKRAYLSSFEACSKVLGTAIFPIDYFFETISRAGKLVVSKIRDESLTSVIEDFAKLPKDFDFYKDNNTGEARKLLSILRSLDSVTSSLLEEWPENQILGQLRVITNRIASFSCTSPTMKLLTGLELLFQKCHEWQKYASSAVSVKGILEEMTQLIVRWRKLELQSWKNLLNNEDRAADMKSSKLWFHFFKSLIVPALVHGHDGVAEPFVESDLIATMDQLLLGSTLGGFHGRLSMLWAFHNHLIAICKESPSETADKMIKVLWNVYKYYAQFQDHVRTHIDIQRKPIVKELDGYVRIATWKDVNVFSLKESSKKSHHHLHKFVKKYRAILNLPVKDVIAAYLQNLAVEGTLVVPKLKSQDFSIDSPNVASHLEISGTCLGQRDSEKLFKRMQVLTATATTEDNRLKVVDGIEELMDVIFDRVEQFQRPLESKSVKGLRSIRKKALVDLLKYLEFLGLSPNASVRYSKYQSSSFLFTLPKLEFDLSTFKQTGMLEEKLSDRTHGLLQKSDEYYFKLLAKMPVIRESSLTSNKDLSDREISKSSSFLENLLQIIVDERQDLSLCADFLQNVTIKNMERCYSSLKIFSDAENNLLTSLDFVVTESLLRSHKKAMDEIDAFVLQASIVVESVVNLPFSAQTVLAEIETVKTKIHRIKSAVDSIFSEHCTKERGKITPFVCTNDVWKYFEAVQDTLMTVSVDFSDISKKYPSISWVFKNLCRRSDILSNNLKAALHAASTAEKPGTSSNTDIASMDLLQKNDDHEPSLSNIDSSDEFGLQSGSIAKTHMFFNRIFKDSRHKKICSIISTALEEISGTSVSETCYNMLGHVYPLMHQYILMYKFRVYEYISFHKTIAKFAHLLSSTFGTLFKKGLCVPEGDEEDKNEDQQEEEATGTGIGEGEGTKDVSNEFEDESQVEGLQNEESGPKPEKKVKEEKNGVEMDGDFDGVMEDVSDNENDEEDDNKNEEKDHEEQMGNVDKDLADVVDEKLWDGDDEKGPKEDEGKTERDSKAEAKAGETDLVAKENDSENSQQQKPADENGREEDENDEHSDEVQEIPGEDQINDMENEYEDNTGVKPKSSIDDSHEVDEVMDLPEDLNLDGEMEDGGKEEQFSDMKLEDEPEGPESAPQDDEANLDEMEIEEFPPEDADAQMDRLEGTPEEDVEMDEVDTTMENGDPEIPDDANKEDKADLDAVDVDDNNELTDTADSNARDRNLGNAESNQTKQQISNTVARDNAETSQDTTELTAGSELGQDNQKRDGGQNDRANEKTSNDEVDTVKNQKQQESEFNPHRSLGDATKKWMERFKNLFDRDQSKETEVPEVVAENEEENNTHDGKNEEFEFVENDETLFDAQVLHAASGQQMDQMDQKALAEEKNREVDAMEVDDEIQQEVDQPSEKSPDDKDPVSDGSAKKLPKFGNIADMDENMPGDEPDEETVESENPIVSSHEREEFDAKADLPESKLEDIEEEMEPLDEATLEQLREQLQASTDEWRKSGQNTEEARALWGQYSALTQELSYSLCESLRLILEPSLATKLKGDYRSGKRLNMRKVIAYIASEFKKDKIWLRRTRPSKRTYQIMMCIDDSLSMAESKSVELAFESLSLISKALTQLEVGEIGIVSFGEHIRLLHPFDKPFSDDAGAEVIRSFTFNQDGTQVRKMMETTIDVMKAARNSIQGGAELWQLQIIISDGILEDHNSVRALVRQAANARIMVVFVGLQMTRYMDTFPFEFYVVLNRIEDLPEVLSDTLRQYFSFVTM